MAKVLILRVDGLLTTDRVSADARTHHDALKPHFVVREFRGKSTRFEMVGLRRRTMYLLTLVSPISRPSLRSSPWTRGAPQSGSSRLIFLNSSRISFDTGGRPVGRSDLPGPKTAGIFCGVKQRRLALTMCSGFFDGRKVLILRCLRTSTDRRPFDARECSSGPNLTSLTCLLTT